MISVLDIEKVDPKIMLSTLWIFVTCNYLYCDVMGHMDSTILTKLLSGEVDGLVITEGFLLQAAVLMELPILMILFSRVLTVRINRISNITVGLIKTVVMLLTLFLGKPTSYYIFFAIIEILTTSFIVIYAWRWKSVSPEI